MEWGYMADGVPEVQKAAREVFRKGSSHIKIMAGGGVATVYDPLDGLQGPGAKVLQLRVRQLVRVGEQPAFPLRLLTHQLSSANDFGKRWPQWGQNERGK